MLNDLRSLTFNIAFILVLLWILGRGCDARMNAWRHWRQDNIDARKDRWDKWWEERRKNWDNWRHRRHPQDPQHDQNATTDLWPIREGTRHETHDESSHYFGNHFISNRSWSIDRLGSCAVRIV